MSVILCEINCSPVTNRNKSFSHSKIIEDIHKKEDRVDCKVPDDKPLLMNT